MVVLVPLINTPSFMNEEHQIRTGEKNVVTRYRAVKFWLSGIGDINL
jgi:hypothetical protein